MAQNIDNPVHSQWQWSWTAREKDWLEHTFKTQLAALLQHLQHTGDERLAMPPDGLEDMAKQVTDAATLLDECAANCYAFAATLQSVAAGNKPDAGPTAPQDRLHAAVGKPVLLTRTTIEELKGEVLILERLADENAIVRHGQDYWGTPVDRILVLAETELDMDPPRTAQPPPQSQTLATDKEGTDAGPKTQNHAFTFHLKQGELGNAIQFLTMAGRQGMLSLACPDNGAKNGIVHVHNGAVAHVAFHNTTGIEALACLLIEKDLYGVFADTPHPPENHLSLSTDQLLIEAAVRADEIVGEYPSPHAPTQ